MGNEFYVVDFDWGDTYFFRNKDKAFAFAKQAVVFKSSKPESAFVDENGHVIARKKGKSKFTARINGKTVTIHVIVTE